MTIEKVFPSGAWLASDIVGNQLVRHIYDGYTKAKATRLFKQKVKRIIREGK